MIHNFFFKRSLFLVLASSTAVAAPTGSSVSPVISKPAIIDQARLPKSPPAKAPAVEQALSHHHKNSESITGTAPNSSSQFAPDPDIHPNALVIDVDNRIGTVQKTYPDGRVAYKVRKTVEISNEISPEVPTNAKYSKDKLYADSDAHVGKPLHFFKDGRINLIGQDGMPFFATELFPETDKIPGYAQGTPVVTPAETTGTVLLLFSNGVVEYKTQTGIAGAHIFGFGAKQATKDEETWIQTLVENIQLGGAGSAFHPTLVVSQAQYSKLKKELLKRIKEDPSLVWDAKLRKKITAFLSR